MTSTGDESSRPPPGASPVRQGEILAGKYRVDRVLAAGGMGIVVAATHIELDQRVALKFVLPSAAGNAGAVDRFLREARAAARLKSEHVAKVIDVGKMDGGLPYMVMEYLDGADLAGVLQRSIESSTPIHPSMAADFVIQACEALAEAHSLGIIHRDLKPQNLFLTHRAGGDPLVKVLDFGISKLMHGLQPALTQTSTLIGSPLYMAPEQMRSAKAADARTDIWALGIVLYELLSGRVPFEADTVPELCLKVVNDAPRNLTSMRRDVPSGLAGVVAQCLEKDPPNRFQTAADLASALEPYASPASRVTAEHARRITNGFRASQPSMTPDPSRQVTATPGVFQGTIAPSAPPRRSWAWAVAGILLLMVLGGAGSIAVKRRLAGGVDAPPAEAPAGPRAPSEEVRADVLPKPSPAAASDSALAPALNEQEGGAAVATPQPAPVTVRRAPSGAPLVRAPAASAARSPAAPPSSRPHEAVAPSRDDEIPSVR